MVKLALFDFDGTLADSFPVFVGHLDEAARRFGFRRLGADEVERLRGLESRAILRELGIQPWKMPAIAAWMRGRMAEERARISLFPGIAAAIERLHAAGVGLGIVSSNDAATIRGVLGEAHARRFSHLECGASLFGKATRLRRAIRAGGVAPDEAIYVGDEIRDAEAARAAGVAFGAVGWGYARRDALRACAPAALFATTDELVATLLGGHPRPR